MLQRVHGWTPSQAGSRLGVLIVCFGCLGMFAGGALNGPWAEARLAAPMGWNHQRHRIGVWSLGADRADSEVMLIWFAPALFFLGLPMGVLCGAAVDLPNQVRGQISALFLLILNLGGQTLGPSCPPGSAPRVAV